MSTPQDRSVFQQLHEDISQLIVNNDVPTLLNMLPSLAPAVGHVMSSWFFVVNHAVDLFHRSDVRLLDGVLSSMHLLPSAHHQINSFNILLDQMNDKDFTQCLIHPHVLDHRVCRLVPKVAMRLNEYPSVKQVFKDTLHPMEAVALARMNTHTVTYSKATLPWDDWGEVLNHQSSLWWSEVIQQFNQLDAHLQHQISTCCPEWMVYFTKNQLLHHTHAENLPKSLPRKI